MVEVGRAADMSRPGRHGRADPGPERGDETRRLAQACSYDLYGDGRAGVTLTIQAGWRLARGAGRLGLHWGRLRLWVQHSLQRPVEKLGIQCLDLRYAAAAQDVVVVMVMAMVLREDLQKLV